MKLEKILIVHPSRGRPEMAIKAFNQLMDNRQHSAWMRYIFSLDGDDPAMPKYMELLPRCFGWRWTALVGFNSGVIEAVNQSARMMTDEDIVINMSDDISSTKGWDVRLAEAIGKVENPEYLIHPNDIQNGENVPIVQILSNALFRRLGYVLPPCYKTMYADQDLLESCQMLGVSHKVQGLGFEHLHPHYGKGQWDDTYARENKPENYAYGEAMLNQRRAERFGLK